MFLFSVILVFSVIFLVVPRARSNVMTQILFQTYFHNIFSFTFFFYLPQNKILKNILSICYIIFVALMHLLLYYIIFMHFIIRCPSNSTLFTCTFLRIVCFVFMAIKSLG